MLELENSGTGFYHCLWCHKKVSAIASSDFDKIHRCQNCQTIYLGTIGGIDSVLVLVKKETDIDLSQENSDFKIVKQTDYYFDCVAGEDREFSIYWIYKRN